MIRILLISFLFISCATTPNISLKVDSAQTNFVLTDESGRYIVKREVKTKGKKIVTRSRLYSSSGTGKPLESSVSVSMIGGVSSARSKERALLPEASQFSVWLEKNKYESQIQLIRASKKIIIKTQSPEKKWNGTKEFELPKGRYFCFFSQLPECLIAQNILLKARRGKIPVYIIWDNYPFHVEQYEGLSNEIFTLASFYFSQKEKNSLRFELDIGNQIIFYHFDRQLKFEKLFWINQGISMTRFIQRSTKGNK